MHPFREEQCIFAVDQDLDEASLSSDYGISRTPVREVLRRLAGEGHVDIRENRGARVIPMNLMTPCDCFLVAPMVYEAVGRLAPQNFKPAQLKELKACQERFSMAMKNGDSEGLNIENNRFHAIIGEMANSPDLRPSLERVLIDHGRIGHTFFHPGDKTMEQNLQKACRHHDQFIEAIAGRDEAAMAHLVFDHWELSRRKMERYVAPTHLHNDAIERITKPRSRNVA